MTIAVDMGRKATKTNKQTFGVIFHDLFLSSDIFQHYPSKHSFRNNIRVSNSLDPDQARRSVGPDVCPNCLQRLSADNKLAAKSQYDFIGLFHFLK